MTEYQSAVAWARAIKEKKVSPVEVLELFLTAIDHYNPALNAIIWRCDAAARAESKLAEAAIMRGDALPPFFGVPIPIKDLSEAQGHPVRQGSRATTEKIGRFDSSGPALVKSAGFIVMGRTHAPEFGTLPVTETAAFGACRNPYDLSRTPGGSSGGAAAAVASGMAPIAHASDGGGSIRIPAACTGLVGLKPSRARIPKGPWVSEVMHGLSTDGCVSRTVEDTAHFLDCVEHFDRSAWYNAPRPEGLYAESYRRAPGKLRIAVDYAGPMGVPLAPEVRKAMEQACKAVTDIGHELVAGPDWSHTPRETLWQDFLSVWSTGPAYVDIEDWSLVEGYNQMLKSRGEKMSVSDYLQAVMRLQIFSRHAIRSFDADFDVLMTPVLAMLPPPIGWLFEKPLESIEDLMERCAQMVPSTAWVNVTGQPAISLPLSTDKASGLPIGVQFVGPPFREDLLLQLGHQLEQHLGWADQRPRLERSAK